jgi:hypothetical protein
MYSGNTRWSETTPQYEARKERENYDRRSAEADAEFQRYWADRMLREARENELYQARARVRARAAAAAQAAAEETARNAALVEAEGNNNFYSENEVVPPSEANNIVKRKQNKKKNFNSLSKEDKEKILKDKLRNILKQKVENQNFSEKGIVIELRRILNKSMTNLMEKLLLNKEMPSIESLEDDFITSTTFKELEEKREMIKKDSIKQYELNELPKNYLESDKTFKEDCEKIMDQIYTEEEPAFDEILKDAQSNKSSYFKKFLMYFFAEHSDRSYTKSYDYLIKAIQTKNFELIKFVLENSNDEEGNGIFVYNNVSESSLDSYMYAAISTRNFEIFKLIYESINKERKDVNLDIFVSAASAICSHEIVKYILNKIGRYIDVDTMIGIIVARRFCKNYEDEKQTVKVILDETYTDFNIVRCIVKAIEAKNVAVVDVILENKYLKIDIDYEIDITIDSKTIIKKTLRGYADYLLEPLYAKIRSKVALTKTETEDTNNLQKIKILLLQAGAKPKTKTGLKGTTLHYQGNAKYLSGEWAEKYGPKSGGTKKKRRSKVRRTRRK